MERRAKLDVVGPASAIFVVIVLFIVLPPYASPQQSPDARIKSLFDQQNWAEVVRQLERIPNRDADLDYYYGSALAQLNRLDEARRAFLDGTRLAPQDTRFPIELGGVAFKQKRYPEAAKWLRRGIRIDPSDEYANDFLATIYFLQGNVEAALKYWNKVGKPRVIGVNTDPALRVRPALLDRAFAFSPASVLRLPDFLTSEARVDGLGIFHSYHFDLAARDDGNFDLNFRAHELDGFGANKWAALLGAFRGLPYETAYLEYFNFGQSATNPQALLRWDDQKRRAWLRFSGPLEGNPKYRWQVGADARNELWALRSSFNAPVFGGLNLRREAVSGSLTSFTNGRFRWSLGGEVSNRRFRRVVGGGVSQFAIAAYELKQDATADFVVWRAPEHRSVVIAGASADTGALWSTPRHMFEKLQGRAEWHWFPQMTGKDYAIHEELRVGKTFGMVPFDELFMLGLERDNGLWLRAHIGTRNGTKGSAPLGRNYFLSNWNIDKVVYDNGLFGVKLSPFFDSGKITDPSAVFGSRQWLFDTGVQLKFSVLGVGVTFTYGKDLRTGNNAFYATTER